MTQIVIGNDFELGVTLTKDHKPFMIDFQAVIKATVVNTDHNTRYFDASIVSPATPGSDLSQSLIIIRFTKAQTVAITKYGPVKIEVAITESNGFIHPSWFVDARTVKGQIT
jgi:hypothetical protein